VGRGIPETIAREIADKVEEGRWVVFVRLPTGYGKSTSAPIIFKELYERGLAFRAIHVLPLRAIVEQLYEKLYCSAAGEGGVEAVRKAFEGAGVGAEDIAYQSGDLLLRFKGFKCGEHGKDREAKKDPAFEAKYVVSTLDSFLMNAMRFPVEELYRAQRHFATPRARIFTSAVFLDEAHYVAGDPNSLASTKLLAQYAVEARIPLIMMSATIASKHIHEILQGHSEKAFRVCLEGDRLCSSGEDMVISDSEFAEEVSEVKWTTRPIEKTHVVKKALEALRNGKKVLIGLMKIEKVSKVCREIRGAGYKCYTLHPGMTAGDRRRVLKKVEEGAGGEPYALAATPVINAGVDLNFDALIAEAPDYATLVQWAGRVCRDNRCGSAEVYVVGGGGVDINDINWRLPFDYKGKKGYGELVERDAAGAAEGAQRTQREVGSVYSKLLRIVRPLIPLQKDITEFLLEKGSPARRAILASIAVGVEGVEGVEGLADALITVDVDDLARCAEDITGAAAFCVEECPGSGCSRGLRPCGRGEILDKLWGKVRGLLERVEKGDRQARRELAWLLLGGVYGELGVRGVRLVVFTVGRESYGGEDDGLLCLQRVPQRGERPEL